MREVLHQAVMLRIGMVRVFLECFQQLFFTLLQILNVSEGQERLLENRPSPIDLLGLLFEIADSETARTY
jgi:hypothetical protein